jgi:hypothetical protein
MNYLAKTVKYDQDQLREKIKVIMMDKEMSVGELSRIIRISALTLKTFLNEETTLKYVTFIKIYKYIIAYEDLNGEK